MGVSVERYWRKREIPAHGGFALGIRNDGRAFVSWRWPEDTDATMLARLDGFIDERCTCACDDPAFEPTFPSGLNEDQRRERWRERLAEIQRMNDTCPVHASVAA
jgi:hypothetical protein